MSRLSDPASTRQDRVDAATNLLRSEDLEDLSALASLLRDQSSADSLERRLAILEAIAARPTGPAALVPVVADELIHGPPSHTLPAIRALRSINTLPAARALLNFAADTARPAAGRAAARDAFLELTRGSIDGPLATTEAFAAASAWLETQTDATWARVAVTAASIARRETLAELDVARGELESLARRYYFSLPIAPPEPRLKFLEESISGGSATLRDTALEIAAREASEGNALDASIGAALLKVLATGEVSVRARAAALLAQIPALADDPRLVTCLAAETDPAVAIELLRAASRRPSTGLLPVARSWMSRSAACQAAAGEAIASIVDAGLISNDPARLEVLEALRAAEPASLTPGAMRVLADLGNDQDRARLANLLDQPPGGPRVAAASVLATRPEYTPRVLAAARSDASLFDAAVLATLASPPDLNRYLALRTLPVRSEDQRTEGLLRASRILSAADLIQLVGEPDTKPEFREALLAPLARFGPELPLARARSDELAIGEAILRLVELRLQLNRPADAYDAMSALPPLLSASDRERATRLKLLALIRSEQMQPAIAVQAPPAAWLDALEQCVREPHAPLIIETIRTRFQRLLSPEEVRRFDDLVARVPRPSDEAPAGDP